MAPLTLPGMVVGPNTFTYSDQSSGERKVRITHEWVERSASKPPDAPPAAVYPADGGVADGTDIRFQWQVPSDPDGDKIADYHFELSNRPDMRWPLSTNFYKLVSKTADRGKAQYTLPEPGLLTPDRTVLLATCGPRMTRAYGGRGARRGVSLPSGPAYPLEVTLRYDQGTQTGTLRWKPNPVGRQPAKYRIYGSDEKGFTVSDVPYKVNVGVSKELPSQFPANFIAETTATELTVIGSQAECAQRHQDLLSGRGGRSAGQAKRTFRLCHCPAADHL